MTPDTPPPKPMLTPNLATSGFNLGELRKRINLSIAKAKFKALPKSEKDKQLAQAMKTIDQLIK